MVLGNWGSVDEINSMWYYDIADWTTILDTYVKPIVEYRAPIYRDQGKRIHTDNKQLVKWHKYIIGDFMLLERNLLHIRYI